MLEVAPHDVRGMRLGKWQRGILLSCGVIGMRRGIAIRVEHGSRSQNVAVLRAARTLEEHGLLVTHKLRRATVVSDRRLAFPYYEDGWFWQRLSPERIHWCDCVAGWLTPFGAGIRDEYLAELRGRKPIRWTDARLERAEESGAREYLAYPDLDIADVEATRKAFSKTRPINTKVRRVGPPGAASNPGRWSVAINHALEECDGNSSIRLWESAVAVFESSSSDAELVTRCSKRDQSRGRKTAEPVRLNTRRTELI